MIKKAHSLWEQELKDGGQGTVGATRGGRKGLFPRLPAILQKRRAREKPITESWLHGESKRDDQPPSQTPFPPNLDAHQVNRQPPEQLHCKTGFGVPGPSGASWTRSSKGQNPGAGARQGLIRLSRSAGALPTHALHPPQPFPAYLPASPALPRPSSPPRCTFGCSGSPRTRPLSSVHVLQDDVTSAALEETQAVGASAAGVA